MESQTSRTSTTDKQECERMRVVCQIDLNDEKELKKRIKDIHENNYTKAELENQISYILRDVFNIAVMKSNQTYF